MSVLLDSQPIVVPKELAVSVGLNESIVIQQIHYWIENNKKAKRNYNDGFYWTYNSIENWHKEFPFWSTRTIRRIFTQLENKGILISSNYNKKGYDRTKWYRINYSKIHHPSPCGQNVLMDEDIMTQPIPEISQRLTNNGNIVTYNGSFPHQNGESEHPPIESKDKDMKVFINTYMNDSYVQKKGIKHPRIRSNQYDRVYNTLSNFISDNDFEVIDLYDIAVHYFNSSLDTDYNINHFATEGILRIRSVDSGLPIAFDD